jgi:hypothetical protein
LGDELFRRLWTNEASASFRAFVFAALSEIVNSETPKALDAALGRRLATSKRASFLDEVYRASGWRHCLPLMPKTTYQSFRADDWQALLAASGEPATRKALGHLSEISPVLVRQLSLIPTGLRLPNVLVVLNTLEVFEGHWRRLSQALADAPPEDVPALIAMAKKIQSFGAFWDFLFHVLERPWRPLELPQSFANSRTLQPLRTRSEFASEGLFMQNCLASEFDEVLNRRRAYFRWQGPPRASVQIIRSPAGWRLGDILGQNNRRLTAEERAPILTAARALLAAAPTSPDRREASVEAAVDALAVTGRKVFSDDERQRVLAALGAIRGQSLGLGPGSSAYCIFETDRGFVQFMDIAGQRELLCEIQSHHFHKELDRTLDSPSVEHMETTGFYWPVGAQNFRRRFRVDKDEQIERFASLALGLLYEMFGFRSGQSLISAWK